MEKTSTFTRTPMPRFYSQYKGVFFRYVPLDKEKDGVSGMWQLSDMDNGVGLCIDFNADTDRIDQCLEKFNEWMLQAIKEGYVRPDSPNFKGNIYFATIRDENGNQVDAWDSVKDFSI